MAAATKIYLLWDTGNDPIPDDWTHETGFNDKFIRCSDTAEESPTGAGSDTHTHTITGNVSSTGAVDLAGSGITVARNTHTHPLSNCTCGNSSSLPPYRVYEVISAVAATTTIKADIIALFDSAPGAGFTAYSDGNDKYIRGGAATVNAGAATHTHGVTGNTGNNSTSYAAAYDKFGGYIADHTHVHSVNITSANGTWLPDAVKVLLYSSDDDQTMPAGLIALFNGDVPTGWELISDSESDYYERLLYADDATGTIGATHTHDLSGTTGAPNNLVNITTFLVYPDGSSYNHTHNISVNDALQATNPMPAYLDMVVGKFEGAAPPARVPKPPAAVGNPLMF